MNWDTTAGLTRETSRGQPKIMRSILLVDDDELQLHVLSAHLSAAGYAVTTAQTGEEACALLRQQTIPLVITDFQMPAMNGLQLIDRIREEEANPHYCIMWSIKADQEDRERSLAHGVDDHVSKELSNAELLARIALGFAAMAERNSQRRLQMMRACRSVLGRDVDTDVWQPSAIRLHSQIAHAVRERLPLSILMLHVERQVAPREKSLLTLTQFNCLIGAINSVLRADIDFALPLDASDGLVRVLLVLPAIDLEGASEVRNRLRTTLAYSAIDEGGVDEADVWIINESLRQPHVAIGIATINGGGDPETANAAAMVVAAEREMQALTMPTN